MNAVHTPGLAAANLAGAAFGAYPSTGSFSRSALSSNAGGKTGRLSCFTASCIARLGRKLEVIVRVAVICACSIIYRALSHISLA